METIVWGKVRVQIVLFCRKNRKFKWLRLMNKIWLSLIKKYKVSVPVQHVHRIMSGLLVFIER